jgi:hypothetical protein
MRIYYDDVEICGWVGCVILKRAVSDQRPCPDNERNGKVFFEKGTEHNRNKES